MTPLPTSVVHKAVNNARTYHQALVKHKSNELAWDIVLAKILYYLRRLDLWRYSIGEGVDSWEDYLKQPEIGIPKGRAEKLIRIYEFYVVKMQMPEQELDKYPMYALDKIAKAYSYSVNQPDHPIEDLLHASTQLTQKDFNELFQDATVGPERTYTYLIMRKCVETGSMEKIHASKEGLKITSDDIVKLLNL